DPSGARRSHDPVEGFAHDLDAGLRISFSHGPRPGPEQVDVFVRGPGRAVVAAEELERLVAESRLLEQLSARAGPGVHAVQAELADRARGEDLADGRTELPDRQDVALGRDGQGRGGVVLPTQL